MKELRLSLGFTQDQLAHYLKISRPLLSLVELGKRTLPTEAGEKLVELQRSLKPGRQKIQNSTEIVILEFLQELVVDREKAILRCNSELHKKQFKLVTIEQKIERVNLRVVIVYNNIENENFPVERVKVNSTIADSNLRIGRYQKKAEQVRYEIDLLELEKKLANDWLQRFEERCTAYRNNNAHLD